jgi:hypothetical protein
MKPVRRRAGAPAAPEQAGTPRGEAPAKPAWRETIDSFGGFVTLGAVAAALVLIGALIIANRPDSPAAASTAALLGEERESGGAANHIEDASLLVIVPGEPPTGGPHFGVPQRIGIYDAAVPDGAVIHTLEHGAVWVTYDPDQVDEATVRQLRDLAREFEDDVLLSPRPENAKPIAAASWGRLLQLDRYDQGQLKAFVRTNRNRSPEPGLR